MTTTTLSINVKDNTTGITITSVEQLIDVVMERAHTAAPLLTEEMIDEAFKDINLAAITLKEEKDFNKKVELFKGFADEAIGGVAVVTLNRDKVSDEVDNVFRFIGSQDQETVIDHINWFADHMGIVSSDWRFFLRDAR